MTVRRQRGAAEPEVGIPEPQAGILVVLPPQTEARDADRFRSSIA